MPRLRAARTSLSSTIAAVPLPPDGLQLAMTAQPVQRSSMTRR